MARGPSSSRDPYVLPSQDNIHFTSIVTTGDLAASEDGPFGGIPDGIGAFDNGDGTITVLLNHEMGTAPGTSIVDGDIRDHGAVGAYIDRIVIDKASLAVVSKSDLIQHVELWNGTNYVDTPGTVFLRFCSGDLPQTTALYDAQTGEGTQIRIYLTGEENGLEGRATLTLVTGPNAGTLYELPSLGNMAYENIVANAYEQDKTIVAMTDDGTNGQVYIYVGQKNSTGATDIDKAGLSGGTFYGIHVDNLDTITANNNEQNLIAADGTFTLVSLGDVTKLNGATIDANSKAAEVTTFLRPEDFAWDPENPNVAYFATTNSFDGVSRIYQLTFNDITHPEAGGSIKAVVESDDYGAHMFDNLTVDNGKVIVQEDPGNQAYVARVWEYDIASGDFTQGATFNPDQFQPGAPNFITQDEESSGAIDVTSLLGDSDTRAYLLNAQVHVRTGDPATVEGGQLLVMYADDATATGTKGDDVLAGNSNTQTIAASNGNDTILAYGGDDNVTGGNGEDSIHGGSGNDILSGDNGNDVLFGDLGNDILSGGRGSDDFVFNNTNFANGTDVITDFAGGDRVLTTSKLNAVNGVVDFGADNDLDLLDGGSVTINGGSVDHLVLLGTVQVEGTTYLFLRAARLRTVPG